MFKKVAKFIRYALFILPIVLFILGVSGKFNIFEEIADQEVSVTLDNKKNRTDDYLVDSRTVVYYDVLRSINSPERLIIGQGVIFNIKTVFAEHNSNFESGRKNVEAGLLNILLRYGILGVITFFLLLFVSSGLGINHSNNSMTVLTGIYISFKFLFLFVEEANISISTYLALSICLNPYIRHLTDYDIKLFFKNNLTIV